MDQYDKFLIPLPQSISEDMGNAIFNVSKFAEELKPLNTKIIRMVDENFFPYTANKHVCGLIWDHKRESFYFHDCSDFKIKFRKIISTIIFHWFETKHENDLKPTRYNKDTKEKEIIYDKNYKLKFSVYYDLHSVRKSSFINKIMQILISHRDFNFSSKIHKITLINGDEK